MRGMGEWGKIGIMEYWNIGVLEYWNNGIMADWNACPPAFYGGPARLGFMEGLTAWGLWRACPPLAGGMKRHNIGNSATRKHTICDSRNALSSFRVSRAGLFNDLSAGEFCPLRIPGTQP